MDRADSHYRDLSLMQLEGGNGLAGAAVPGGGH
jgi:hypothetical protein